MPWQFWGFLILGVIGPVVAAVGFIARKANPRGDGIVGVAAGGVIAAIALVLLIFASFTIVGTRHVGIVTSFGKPTGETLSNGLHWVAPWKSVTELDAAIQNDVYRGDNRILVRLGNNSTALADANIRWQIKQDAADELFVQYKTFDNIKSNLIDRNLRVALNEAFATYDPLAVPRAKEGEPVVPISSPLPTISAKAFELLKTKVGEQVEILEVSVPTIDFDDTTEQRINQINEERANTTKAAQQVQTNVQKRLAAEELAKQPVPDLKIAIANCLNKVAESGQNLNCFPIGGNVIPTLAVPNPAG